MFGALPTRTSVDISIDGATRANIPAATRASAGAMTAAQVASLEDLMLWHKRIMTGADVGNLSTDVITRDELATELKQHAEALRQATRGALASMEQKIAAAAAQSSGPAGLPSPEGMAQPFDISGVTETAEMAARGLVAAADHITSLQERAATLEMKVAELFEIMHGLKKNLGVPA